MAILRSPPGPEVYLQCAMVRRQGPAGAAPIADVFALADGGIRLLQAGRSAGGAVRDRRGHLSPEEDPDPTAAVEAKSGKRPRPRRRSVHEMDHQITAWPTEYYQLAVSYRSAPHADLHHAEIGRFTDPDLGPVIAYDAPGPRRVA